MKMMKRSLALLLCFLMLSSGPISAFATEGVSDNDNDDPVVCTVCGVENCETTHVYCDTCEKYDCGLTHTTCDKCGTVDCQSTHEAWCDTCKKDSCGVDHTTPPADNGSSINGEAEGCTECGETEGHLDSCSQYINPIGETAEVPIPCSLCGQSGTHSVGCFATFTEVNQVGYFVSDSVTLYRNPTQQPDDTITLTAEQLPESFTVQYSFPGDAGVTWYMLDTENWNTEYSEYGYVNAADVTFEDTSAATDQEVSESLGTHTLTVSGTLLDGVGLDAAELEADMSDFIHSGLLGLEALAEDEMALAYDISLQVGENKVQPDGTVTVKLDGLDTNKYTEFTVYHLPNTDVETIRKVMDGETIMLDAPETLTPVTVGDGYIEFETDSFSIYYILAGSLSGSSGNDTFYILRGTAVELTNVTSDNFTVTYPNDVTAENSGVTLTRSDNNTLTVTATSTAQYGTYSVKINNRRTATIIVLTPEEIFAMVDKNDVYFTCVRNSTNVPSEPMSGGNYSWTYITDINNGEYSFTNSWGGAFQSSPAGFLKLDVIANSDSLEQNLQGQNVIGVIDDGWGADTLPCVNYTDEQWHELLKQFVEHTSVQISNGAGGTVTLTSSMVNEKLENGTYRYKMYPYVVKLILESSEYQKGWHVDCAIVDTKTYSVSYEYNLPSTALIQESSGLIKPEMAFYSPGTDNVKVGVMTLGRANVTGDTSVTIYDTNTQSTSEYKFLYWNTEPDGSGTSYNPDDILPAITENVVLYAIWNHTQTSGSLKLQKAEIFEDVNDDRKDGEASYTFTVTFANAEAGKSYPYTIYNSDNTAKSADNSLVSGGTIVLKAGEYAVVNNVPGGSVTVSESVAEDSEFDVSWNVAGSKTEGSAVTATVTAGNQTEIVCVNTYSPLVADLTITKTGARTDLDENQSFIFDVVGPNDFKITVTINGNGSVTIKDVPFGQYTVTENTDWSWRYTPTGGPSKTMTLVANDRNEVEFENTRSWIYWLSGDGCKENQFTVKSKED